MTSILITGHAGYVGSILADTLRRESGNYQILGFDTGFFQDDLWPGCKAPENLLHGTHCLDIRDVTVSDLEGIDTIIHLASVSNDPIGKTFAAATMEINLEATLKLAQLAKEASVTSFVFASSCSIYGATDNRIVDETAPQKPLTEYAKSKVQAEEGLRSLASPNFRVTNLRFGTACGFSPRLRLDLVVNDFVATAVATNKIQLLSSGSAWRPFVHVQDMARAIAWAVSRKGEPEVTVNVGSDAMCMSIRELATLVGDCFEGSQIIIPEDNSPDNRSYRVSFQKFQAYAPEFQPRWNMRETVMDLRSALLDRGFNDGNFRSGKYMRLNKLNALQQDGRLNTRLRKANQPC